MLPLPGVTGPGPGSLGGQLAEVVGQRRRFLRGTDVTGGHSQEFVARIAVVTDRRLIYLQESARLQIRHPHGHGVAVENEAVLAFAFARLGLGEFALPAFFGFLHGPADGGHQPFQPAFEHVISGAAVEKVDGGVFANRARQDDEWNIRTLLPGRFQCLQPVAGWQHIVRNNCVVTALLQRLGEALEIGDEQQLGLEPLSLHQRGHQGGEIRLIFQM